MVGRPKKVSDKEILKVLHETDERVMTASEIGDELGESRRTLHRRLDELHDDGKVEKKKVGGRSVVWWTETGHTQS